MVELKGHEERRASPAPLGAMHGVNRRRQDLEGAARGGGGEARLRARSPMCLIIGGGQGAHRPRRAAAATRRADDHRREERARPAIPGAIATSRSACTTPSGTTTCPIIDFPKNWPVFSPKDKIGDWLEMYAKVMELNYWGSTTAKRAELRRTKKEWTVVVERDGKEVTLQPKQLVFATGMSAKPNMPKFKGMETFKGDQHHSSKHPGPDGLQGQEGRRHRLQQFRARHLRGAVGERRRRDDGAALAHAYRALRHADGDRPRRSLFRARGARRA